MKNTRNLAIFILIIALLFGVPFVKTTEAAGFFSLIQTKVSFLTSNLKNLLFKQNVAVKGSVEATAAAILAAEPKTKVASASVATSTSIKSTAKAKTTTVLPKVTAKVIVPIKPAVQTPAPKIEIKTETKVLGASTTAVTKTVTKTETAPAKPVGVSATYVPPSSKTDFCVYKVVSSDNSFYSKDQDGAGSESDEIIPIGGYITINSNNDVAIFGTKILVDDPSDIVDQITLRANGIEVFTDANASDTYIPGIYTLTPNAKLSVSLKITKRNTQNLPLLNPGTISVTIENLVASNGETIKGLPLTLQDYTFTYCPNED